MHQLLGHKAKQLFDLDPTFIHFNSGSFGIVPKQVIKERIRILKQTESLPDYYLKQTLGNRLNKTLLKLSKKINCKPQNLVLINNTMEGINIVVNQIEFTENDLLVITSLSYIAVQNVVESIKEKYIIKNLVLDLELGESNQQLLKKTEEFLKNLNNNYNKKIIILEAISSTPALVLPVNSLVDLFKKYGFLVLVDGAHCFGQVDVDLGNLNADFFITNLYKWGYCTRPSALLYVRDVEQYTKIRPLITTFNYKEKGLRNRFSWPGTMDFSCFLSIDAALEFSEKTIGEDIIQLYNRELCIEGGVLIAKILGDVNLIQPRDKEQIGFMINIRLPYTPKANQDLEYGMQFETLFLKKYKMLIKLFEYKNQWYVRLSAQIHLNLEDFRKLGLSLKKELFQNKL